MEGEHALKVYQMNRKQLLHVSLDDAWSFFADPNNLQKLTPPKMRMKVIDKHPSELYAGMIATYKIRPIFNIPITWVTEVTQVLSKEYFIDEQRFGPFKFWHHEHRFKQTDEGVEMTDLVHYAMPFSIIGKLVHAQIVRPKLQAMFAYRQKQLRFLLPNEQQCENQY